MDLRRIYQFIWHPGIWQHDRNNYIVTTNAQNNYILFEFCPSITNESWTDMHAESTQAPTCWHWASWRDSACGVGGQCCWTLSWRCEFCSPFIHTHSPVLELLLLYFSEKKRKILNEVRVDTSCLAVYSVSSTWSMNRGGGGQAVRYSCSSAQGWQRGG